MSVAKKDKAKEWYVCVHASVCMSVCMCAHMCVRMCLEVHCE